VDHPLPALDAQIRPWRTAAYVAGAVAAVELVLLLVLGGGALAGAVANRVELAAADKAFAPVKRPQAAPAARKPAPVPAAHRPRSRTTVLVLNGNGRPGAAATAAARVQRRGYRISAVTNASRHDFQRSIVMYRPGFAGEGHRLARDLGVKVVGPLDGMRLSQLHAAHVVFILGS
jgi:LytR cell envelope-related transcriptional attenuator